MAVTTMRRGKQKDAPFWRALSCELDGGSAGCAQTMSSFLGICFIRLTMLK